MFEWKDYQKQKYKAKTDKLLVTFLKHYNGKKNAIDLGCGSFNETVYLLKKEFKVISIDKEINKSFIYNRITEEEKNNVKIIESNFEAVTLPKTSLIIAFYSIPFCSPDNFKELWNKIYESLENGGYFVGQLFGDRDAWADNKNINTFSLDEVKYLLNNYKIEKLEEVEYVRTVDNKKWHYYNIIARKLL